MRKRLIRPSFVGNYAVRLAFALLCLQNSIAIAQTPDDVIKVDVALVTVNISVTDSKGRPLLGLKSKDFFITDEDKPVNPEFFDGEGPSSIVFLIDTSSSMTGPKWKSLMTGLKDFLRIAREGNDYTLVTFDSTPHVIASSVNKAELQKYLDTLEPGGDTALYDAVLVGLKELKRVGQRHKALVMISDGEDNSSRRSLEEVGREVSAQQTTIYSIGLLFGHYCSVGVVEACRGKETIGQMSKVTGGMSHFPDLKDLSKVLIEVSNDIRNQYTVSYYPPDKISGWRRVKVNTHELLGPSKLRYQSVYFLR